MRIFSPGTGFPAWSFSSLTLKLVSRRSSKTTAVNGIKSSVSQKFAENIFVVCENCDTGKSCSKIECQIKLKS